MARMKLVLGLLAISLAVSGVHAQSAPAAAAQSPANAIDPASIEALKSMGNYLQTLKRFQARTEVSGERVLMDGQKLQHSASATVDVVRPNKVRARMVSARSERELIFDGKTVAMYIPAQKVYSSVEFNDTLEGLIGKLQERYGVEVPLSDLFVWGTPAAPFDKIESAMNAGQDFIGNDLCDHYAFRQGNLDWQVWVMTGARTLPRKIVITNRSDEARPQSVSLISWNLNPTFKDSSFTFVPPKGATKAEVVPVKRK
jgi:hypothetical protein